MNDTPEIFVTIPADLMRSHGLASRELRGHIARRSQKAAFFVGRASMRPSPNCLRCAKPFTDSPRPAHGYHPECNLGALGDLVEMWMPLRDMTITPTSSHPEAPTLDAFESTPVIVSVTETSITVRSHYMHAARLRALNGSKWSRSERHWRYPRSPTTAAEIMAMFAGYEMITDEGFGLLIAQAERMAEAEKFREAEGLPDVPGLKTVAWDHQRRAFWFSDNLPATLLAMQMGEQPHRTPTLTPTGWRAFGDLVVGDSVIGSNGKSTKVLEIKEFESRELVRVNLRDGASVECASTHPWTVRRRGDRPWVTVTAGEIERSLQDPRPSFKLDQLPELAPVQFSRQRDPLPLDPYVLGLLLADGHFGCCENATVSWGKSDLEVVQRMRDALPENIRLVSSTKNQNAHWLRPIGAIRPILHELNLCGVRSSEKRIPPLYLRAGIAERRALLRGLIDGDGTRGGRCYSTISPGLADDVSELCRLLGGKGSITRIDHPRGIYYTITLGLDLPLRRERTISSIERTGIFERMRCILVEADDHLYVTDGGVLTHNTGKSLVALGKVAKEASAANDLTLIVCPLSVTDVWPREFARHANFPIGVVQISSSSGRVKGTLERRVKAAQEQVALNRARGIPTVLVVNYESVWRPPCATWFTKTDFAMIIC